jgi:nitroreductase
MSKEAKTNNNEILPLLKKRWSPRAFDDRPVELQKLRNILEAARWSPSASNNQPWVFFLGTKGDATYNKIYQTLVEFNQMWTKFAPVLILNCGKITTAEDAPYGTWQYDTGQSVAHLTIQATDEGLYVHQMSGFDALKAAELFALPEDVQAISVTALGYIGDPAVLHPRMQKSELDERERKEMDTFVFFDEFGRISDIIK